MKIINHSIRTFATLNAQALANKNRNSVRFQSQNLSWDFEVVDYHCRAFGKGLHQCDFAANDNLLIRVPPSQQAESYVAKVGTSYIDSNLIISRANTIEQLDRQISEHKISGIIFQPTLALGEKLLIDCLYDLMPEIRHLNQGSNISVSRYNTLKMLIQTNFYSYPGVFKYRSIFDYSSDSMTPFSVSSSHEPLPIPQSSKPLIITQPAHPFAFKAGILNSLINGRYIVCAESNDVSRVSNVYDNNVDVITTQECIVPEGAGVIVERGSSLLSGHKNRVQI